MARVPLIGENDRPELTETIAHLKASRGGRLINLYRVLLHSPTLALAWLQFNSAVRFQTGLSADLRELAILRVAILNGAEYQVRIHGPKYAREAGLSEERIAALGKWQASDLYTPSQRAMLAYADAMTQAIEVSDAAHSELARHFSERQVVELTVLIGAYNMHTRVSRALRIDAENRAEH